MGILFSILMSLPGASSPEVLFEEANMACSQGAYAEAAAMYEQMILDGVHDPVVFFNLGNAYLYAGRLGPAVANFERALHLAPDFKRARVNLDYALASAERRLARPLPPWWEQTLLFWHDRFSPRFVYAAAVVSWFLLWSVLAVRRWRPFRYSRLLVLVVAGAAGLFGMSAWAKAHPVPVAVASQASVPVRYAIGDTDVVHFELYAGDRVAVEERQSGWILISSADGKRGWASGEDMTFVGPPYEPAPAEKAPQAETRMGGAT